MMRHLGRLLGVAADRALNQLWPLEVHTRAYLAQVRVADKAAEDLAEAEATVEVTEPPLLPWEQELVDADLWAAEQRNGTITNLGDGQTIDDLVRTTRQPAGAVAPPASATGAGGSPTIDEVATVAAVILRRQGILSAPIYADLVARELRHHFDITRK